INSVDESVLSPFRPGDRVVSVAGRRLKRVTDLIQVIDEATSSNSLPVEIVRKGQTIRDSWMICRDDGEAKTSIEHTGEIPRRLGFSVQAFALDPTPACRVTTTRDGSPSEIRLPRGSYLFLLRKEGYADTRLPVTMPVHPSQKDAPFSVRLLKPAEIPDGFVYVPGGPFPSGGDTSADSPLPTGYPQVGDFLIQRLEVTVGDWAKFLNARSVPESGRTKRSIEWPSNLVPKASTRRTFTDHVVTLAPRVGNARIFKKSGGRWVESRFVDPEDPMFRVSLFVALEYAKWYDEIHGNETWRFRLPNDEEWEKAARGADRRIFPWGSAPIYTFCGSRQGMVNAGDFRTTGSFPFDESPYGVRDLSGGRAEVLGVRRSQEHFRFVTVRGGSYSDTDDYFFRVTNRNGILPEIHDTRIGLRLVAVPAESE
ncbi:MAG: SUMF1/EgtB/PvdO family nonheme iron enzyme, partial [Planctomycetota bacterium]